MEKELAIPLLKIKRPNYTNKHKQTVPILVQEVIRRAEIVLEILDARFIERTRNKEMEKLVNDTGRKLVFVINKTDLVDLEKLKKTKEVKELNPKIFFSSKFRKGIANLRNQIKIEAKKLKLDRGINVGVVGYPNAGKSSIINMLVGRNVARTSPEAGFTKGFQKLRLSSNLFLIDTPGIIPSQEVDFKNYQYLAKHGLIGVKTWDKVREPEFVISDLMKKYPNLLEEYYKIPAKGDSEFLIEEYGKKKNILKKGGLIDTDRTSRVILKDFQDGKIRVD